MGDLVRLTTKDPLVRFLQTFSPFDRVMELVEQRLDIPASSGTVKVVITAQQKELCTLNVPASYFSVPKTRIDAFIPTFSLEAQRVLLKYPRVNIRASFEAIDPLKAVRAFEVDLCNNLATDDPYVQITEEKGQYYIEGQPTSFKYGKPAEGDYALEAFHTVEYDAVLEVLPVMESARSLRPLFQYVMTDARTEGDTLLMKVQGPAALFFVNSGKVWKPRQKVDICSADVGAQHVVEIPEFEVLDVAAPVQYAPPVAHDENPLGWPVLIRLEANGREVATLDPIAVRYPFVIDGQRVHLDVETVRRCMIAVALLEQKLYSDTVHAVGERSVTVGEARKAGSGFLLQVPIRSRGQGVYEGLLRDYSFALDTLTLAGRYLQDMWVTENQLWAVCDDSFLLSSVRHEKSSGAPLTYATDAFGYSNVVAMSVLLSYVTAIARKGVGQATLCSTLLALMSISINADHWKETRLGQGLPGLKAFGGSLAYDMEEVDVGVEIPAGLYPTGTLFLVRESQASGARVFVCRTTLAYGETCPLQIVYDPYSPMATAGNVLVPQEGCEYSIRALKGFTVEQTTVNGRPSLSLSVYGDPAIKEVIDA